MQSFCHPIKNFARKILADWTNKCGWLLAIFGIKCEFAGLRGKLSNFSNQMRKSAEKRGGNAQKLTKIRKSAGFLGKNCKNTHFLSMFLRPPCANVCTVRIASRLVGYSSCVSRIAYVVDYYGRGVCGWQGKHGENWSRSSKFGRPLFCGFAGPGIGVG